MLLLMLDDQGCRVVHQPNRFMEQEASLVYIMEDNQGTTQTDLWNRRRHQFTLWKIIRVLHHPNRFMEQKTSSVSRISRLSINPYKTLSINGILKKQD